MGGAGNTVSSSAADAEHVLFRADDRNSVDFSATAGCNSVLGWKRAHIPALGLWGTSCCELGDEIGANGVGCWRFRLPRPHLFE